MISAYNRPAPVLSLLVLGSLLILAEGLFELVISSGVLLPAVLLVNPGLTIGLGFLLLLLSWVYASRPSAFLGGVFLLLGATSFLLGAGFVVGGVLIVIAGALAVLAEWVSETFAPRAAVPGPAPPSGPWPLDRKPGPSPPASDSTVVGNPARTAQVVIYKPCPHCGQLNRPEFTRCLKCGAPTT